MREISNMWGDYKAEGNKKINSKLQPKTFRIGDLVWWMYNNSKKNDDNLSFNWKGMFWVAKDVDKGAYTLEYLSEESIPNTWNVTHLKLYFR